MSLQFHILFVVVLFVLLSSQSNAAGKNYCLWSYGCNAGTTRLTAPVESDCAPGLVCIQARTKANTLIGTICVEDKNLVDDPPGCTLTNEAGLAPCCNSKAIKIGTGAAALCRLGPLGVCTQRFL